MNISVAVMTHPKRAIEAKRLFDKLKTMPFSYHSLVVDMKNDEWSNGETCLQQSFGSDWHIVIQDDAIISEHFYENVKTAIEAAPYKTLISFYTGMVRPFPSRVQWAVEEAARKNTSFIQAFRLFWGVGFAIPVDQIAPMLKHAETRPDLPFDQRISRYYDDNAIPVLYTYPSIVDHDYKIESIVGNADIEPRKAHRYDPGIVRWNSNAVLMW